MKKAMSLAGLFMAAAVLTTGCGSGAVDVKVIDHTGGQKAAVKLLTEYDVGVYPVSEYVSPSDATQRCVLADSESSGAVLCFTQPGTAPAADAKPQILSHYEVQGYDVYEFVPASHPGKVCVIADGNEALGLHCYDHKDGVVPQTLQQPGNPSTPQQQPPQQQPAVSGPLDMSPPSSATMAPTVKPTAPAPKGPGG